MRRILDKLRSSTLPGTPKPIYFPLWTPDSTIRWHASLIGYDNIRQFVRNGLPDNRLTICESGGFAVKMAPDQKQCLLTQLQLDVDIVLALDFPFGVKTLSKFDKLRALDKPEAQRFRILRKNIDNVKEVLKLRHELGRDDVEVMAVAHAWNKASFIYIVEEFLAAGCDMFSLSDLSDNASSIELIERHEIIRDLIGRHCWFHSLGTTSVSFLARIKHLIDSFDSSTAVTSAARMHTLSAGGKWESAGMKSGTLRLMKNNPRFKEVAEAHTPLYPFSQPYEPDDADARVLVPPTVVQTLPRALELLS